MVEAKNVKVAAKGLTKLKSDAKQSKSSLRIFQSAT